jgi:hypothetical protein
MFLSSSCFSSLVLARQHVVPLEE